MKIYEVIYQDSSDGFCLEWHPTKVKARKACVKIRKKYQDQAKKEALEHKCHWHKMYENPDTSFDCIEIQLNKKDILIFLNARFNRDNG